VYLIQAADGSFQGTRTYGGEQGGIVFRLDAAGVLRSVHSFLPPDGGHPYAGPIQDTDGSFYGTTRDGGMHGLGTVFRIGASGMPSAIDSSGTLTTVHTLSERNTFIIDSLLLAADGAILVTSYYGGPAGGGVVFRLTLEPPATLFHRGDCDLDGQVRGVVTDAIFLLTFNFLGGMRPACLAACDANADGQVSGVVTDAIFLLSFNFLGGAAPPSPFPDCGPGERQGDATLGCETPPADCAGGG
jgi:uncharacterized repeat protein (TIGR03803 family)